MCVPMYICVFTNVCTYVRMCVYYVYMYVGTYMCVCLHIRYVFAYNYNGVCGTVSAPFLCFVCGVACVHLCMFVQMFRHILQDTYIMLY